MKKRTSFYTIFSIQDFESKAWCSIGGACNIFTKLSFCILYLLCLRSRKTMGMGAMITLFLYCQNTVPIGLSINVIYIEYEFSFK